ncbi:putative LPS assembly protein LptD [Fodinibius halophilus]|uniref:LPS-assembly protein LptD n=1 Tax=Fodinibius halophilus TaxID=1736908 RepID=A0A6M1T3J6_9BACT|nr:putative LPS assembly protein LptD [Fodinibius halophilus]NGP88649.1 LPS-assembly protein LptD [Fodinibius halophilus]
MSRFITYSTFFTGMLLLLLLGLASPLVAQIERPPVRNQEAIQNDTTRTSKRASAQTPQQEGQINFQASDSLVFNNRENRIATLYGSSSVVHSSGELQSGKVAMNLDSSLVSATTQTPQDTLSQPVLIRENDRVRSNKIDFNYKTEKGRFEVARVEVQDGNLIGTKVKNTGRDVVFLEDAIYSTCQLDHPHYYIQAKRMKVVEREKIFFEQARLFILDIPYPLVFPFGYLPGKFDKKQSGILEPTYAFQDRQNRGIGLQNLGWFQYFNDYLTGQASFDIFTSGDFFVDSRVRYRVRDKLSGNIRIGYSRNNSGLESSDPDFSSRVSKEIKVSHNQDFSPYASFNSSIHLRTEDFNKINSNDPTAIAETDASSSINYKYRHPESVYSLNASIRQNQNFANNTTKITGPELNFSLNRFSPFKNEETTGDDDKWYESISVNYDNTFNSKFKYRPERADSARYNWFEALKDPDKYRKATGNTDHYRFGFKQNAGISMNQLLPNRFLNTSLNLNYNDYWYPTTTRKSFNSDSVEVVERQVRGLTSAHEFNTSLNFSTRIYGLMNLNLGNLKSFRHTLKPSISLSYRPDFSNDLWGYYRTVQTDTVSQPGDPVPTERYSIFENEIFRGPGQGEQRQVNFRLGNVFEAKSVKRDSTGEKKEEVINLIDQLDFSSSYNFAADSLKLSDLRSNLRAKILPGMNINASANFNFYERNSDGNKIDDFLVTNSSKLMELTRFRISTSYSVQLGERGFQPNTNPHYPANYNPLNQSIFRPVDPHFNTQPVQDFKSPFSFSINFSYNWRLNPTGKNNTTATINAQNINLKLTPKWDFRTQIGYDFIQKELTPSQFSLNRKLHCWDLSFTMNPFGDRKYYFFSLRINASRLQGIIQKLPGLNNLERGSRGTGRSPRGFGGGSF